MGKGLIVALAILAVVFISGCSVVTWAVGTYNGIIKLDEGVNQSWAQVQNQYQRRMDLIPNLVEVVKGYASHESETFIEVSKARASVGQMTITPEVLKDPKVFQKFQEAQSGLTQALSRLMVVAEKYPELKANENFLQLQGQLEGTENRISVERKRYTESVQEYNVKIRVFPGSFIASFGGFTAKPQFEADQVAQKAPTVSFAKPK